MQKVTVVALLAFLTLALNVLQPEGSNAVPFTPLPLTTTGGGDPAWPDPDANGAKLSDAPPVPADRTDIHRPEDALAPTSRDARLDAGPPDPLVEEVAAALRNDPLAIYNYVKTEIAFEPVYGLKRDPHRTILERAGTDSDQAFLLVELLRAAGVDASYLYGTVTLPLDLAASWVRVERDPSISTTCDRILAALANGGVPVVDPPPCADNATEEFGVQHVWVAADIGGVVHELDPSVKHNERIDGIDLGTALGYDRATFLANAEAGATITPESVANLNETSIGADLEQYAANLVAQIEASDPHAYVQDIVGGWETAEAPADVLPDVLPYPSTIAATFSDFDDPDVDPDAPELRHKVTIKVYRWIFPFWFLAITYDTTLPAIAGRRLTYQCSGSTATLRLEGEPLGTAGCSVSQMVQFCVDAPFPADGGSSGDECAARPVSAGSGKTHALVAEVGRTPEGLLAERRAILAANQAAFPPESEQVLGETLNVLGLSWFNEVGASARLHEAVAGVNSYRIHGYSVMSQETISGLTSFGIDAQLNFSHVYSPVGSNEDRFAWFRASTAQSSGIEHAFIEQLQDKEAISTIRVLELANGSMPVFLATPENWCIGSPEPNPPYDSCQPGSVRPQLSYSSTVLGLLDDDIAAGWSLVVPQTNVTLNSWTGTGWNKFVANGEAYMIKGGLSGGFSTEPGPTDPNLARDLLALQQEALFGPTPGRPPEQGDPVDAQTGALTLRATDITIRGTRPLSLEDFGRSYNSGVAGLSGPLGFGWRHTYDWTLNTHSDYARGLEGPEAVEAARLIAQAFVVQDLFRNPDLDPLQHERRTIAALAIKWGMDRLTDNALVLTGPDGANGSFLELPDGRFSRSARLPWDLIKNLDGSITLDGRAGQELDFDEVVNTDGSSSWRLASWTDGNGNTLHLTYDAPGPEGKLIEVRDAVDRTLTFTYWEGSSYIRTVADHPGLPGEEDPRTVEFTYYPSGDLETVLDVRGGTTTYTYLDHRLLSIRRDPEGLTILTNVYDDRGRVEKQTDGMLNDTFIYYGDHLTRIENPRGDDRVVTWTDDGRRQQITDEAGFATTSSYDASGNLVELEEAESDPWTFSYDLLDNLTAATDPLTHGTDFEYDGDSRPTLVRDALGRQSEFMYDLRGNLTRLIRRDLGGVIKALTCLERHPQTGQVTALVESTDLAIHPEDQCIGHKTKFEYDPYGNPQAIVDPRFSSQPTPPKTILVFDRGGRMRSVTNELAEITTYEYDPQNNLLSVNDNLNDTTTYTYDPRGNLETITDANRQPEGPPETGQDQCGSAGTGNGEDNDGDDKVDDGCPSMIYDYDNAYRLWQVIDATGHFTTYGYDPNGNRTSVTNAKRQPVGSPETGDQCGPSGTGNRINEDSGSDTVADDGCPSTVYVYDPLDRLQSVTDALGRVTSYAYDPAGNLSQRTDARSLVTKYRYDDRHLLEHIDHYQSDGQTLVDFVDYTYDAVGNRRTMTDGTGSTQYDYDALNRLTSVMFPGPKTVSYQYDDLPDGFAADYPGQRTVLTYPDTKTVQYTYDEANNLKTVADWQGKTTNYVYDDVGRPRDVGYPAGSTSMTYHYDLAGRLDEVTHGGVAPKTISYILDAVGNRTQMQVDLGTPATYEYDPLYRLKSVIYPEGASTGYTYDPVGNRRTMSPSGSSDTTYTYDDADELTSVAPPGQPAVNYTYDSNGNLKSRASAVAAVGGIAEAPELASSGGSGPPLAAFAVAGGVAMVAIVVAAAAWRTKRRGPIVMLLLVLTVPLLAEWGSSETQAGPAATPGADTFEYDHENRLTQAVIGGVAFSSTYNGDGLRMSHTVSGVTTDYTWDVASPLPVVLQDSDGNTYVYGLDLISRTDGAGNQEYYLYDGLGSTTGLVDGSGNSVASYGYDVFGAIRTQSGSSPNYWLFTGEQRDSESDLYYLRARYYDPSTGRFLTQDPSTGSIVSPQSLNRYPYVRCNPVNHVDPTGMRPEGGGCNVAEAITGGLLSGLGLIMIAVPGFYALTQPEAIPAGIFLLEVVALPVEVAAFRLMIHSGCIDLD